MKEWARAFYSSKAWEETRKAFLADRFHLCERCGMPAKIVHHRKYIKPENINDIHITLCWDNLESLCQDCHNKEHHGTNKNSLCYSYDKDGKLIERHSPPIKNNLK